MYNTYIENWEGRLTHQPTSLPWWKRNIFSPISSLFIYQVFVDCFSLSSSSLPFIISSSVPILKQCFPNKVFTFSYEHFSHVSSLLISAWIYLTSVFFFSVGSPSHNLKVGCFRISLLKKKHAFQYNRYNIKVPIIILKLNEEGDITFYTECII